VETHTITGAQLYLAVDWGSERRSRGQGDGSPQVGSGTGSLGGSPEAEGM